MICLCAVKSARRHNLAPPTLARLAVRKSQPDTTAVGGRSGAGDGARRHGSAHWTQFGRAIRWMRSIYIRCERSGTGLLDPGGSLRNASPFSGTLSPTSTEPDSRFREGHVNRQVGTQDQLTLDEGGRLHAVQLGSTYSYCCLSAYLMGFGATCGWLFVLRGKGCPLIHPPTNPPIAKYYNQVPGP